MFARLYICQLISVSRVVALMGSESIKAVQSVHLFVRDEAQRMAGTVTWHTESCDIIQYHYYGTCVRVGNTEPYLGTRVKNKCAISSQLRLKRTAKCEKTCLTTTVRLMCELTVTDLQ